MTIKTKFLLKFRRTGVNKKRSLKNCCSQMSGNPVRIRDGCATVTATNSQCHCDLHIREGGSEV